MFVFFLINFSQWTSSISLTCGMIIFLWFILSVQVQSLWFYMEFMNREMNVTRRWLRGIEMTYEVCEFRDDSRGRHKTRDRGKKFRDTLPFQETWKSIRRNCSHTWQNGIVGSVGVRILYLYSESINKIKRLYNINVIFFSPPLFSFSRCNWPWGIYESTLFTNDWDRERGNINHMWTVKQSISK